MAIDPKNLSNAQLTYNQEFDSFKLWDGISGLDTRPGWAMWPQYNSGFTLTGNNEKQWYIQPDYAPTASQNPFSIKSGVLTITAKPTDPSIAGYINNYPYTSGAIHTYHEFSQTYGYFEMRAQLPAGKGLWPAFWLLPADNSSPAEIDIMEMIGSKPTSLATYVHSGTDAKIVSTGKETTVSGMTTGFHTYGVDWQADKIAWYFDGNKLFETATPAGMNKPMYMIANLAVGGNWPGSPDSSTPFPAEMKIDYIRAYKEGITTQPAPTPSPTPAPSPTPIKAIHGTDGRNTLTGTSVAEQIFGYGGNDKLNGKFGNDILSGGSGKDIFVFDTTPDPISNLDTIMDFKVVDDTVYLENAIFTRLGSAGKMNAKQFWIGAKAHDADDRIIYDNATGSLYYDKDGTGASAAIEFAKLTPKLMMTASDFLIV